MNDTREEKLPQGSPAIRTTTTCRIGLLRQRPLGCDSEYPDSQTERKQAMYRSCYTNPYGETYPNKKPTTRLQDMWNAVGQTQDDNVAIALVESHGQHIGMGTDETHEGIES